jgi:hypothetical protein
MLPRNKPITADQLEAIPGVVFTSFLSPELRSIVRVDGGLFVDTEKCLISRSVRFRQCVSGMSRVYLIQTPRGKAQRTHQEDEECAIQHDFLLAGHPCARAVHPLYRASRGLVFVTQM